MEREQKARTQNEPVGYGSPPVDHQFPNNPKRQVGRKKGSKNKPKLPPELTESERIALEEGKRLIGPPGAQVETARAVARAQAKTALQGGTNAQKAILARMDAIERKERENRDAIMIELEAYVWMAEIALKKASPEQRAWLDENLLPHPYDVEVDFKKRTILVHGPSSTMERREWDALKADLATIRETMMELKQELEQSPRDKTKQYLYYRYGDALERACEALPPRHRPEPVKDWLQTKAMKLMFNDLIRNSKADLRRLERDPSYFEEFCKRYPPLDDILNKRYN